MCNLFVFFLHPFQQKNTGNILGTWKNQWAFQRPDFGGVDKKSTASTWRIIPGLVSVVRIEKTPIYKPWRDGHLEGESPDPRGLTITMVINHVLNGLIHQGVTATIIWLHLHQQNMYSRAFQEIANQTLRDGELTPCNTSIWNPLERSYQIIRP